MFLGYLVKLMVTIEYPSNSTPGYLLQQNFNKQTYDIDHLSIVGGEKDSGNIHVPTHKQDVKNKGGCHGCMMTMSHGPIEFHFLHSKQEGRGGGDID